MLLKDKPIQKKLLRAIFLMSGVVLLVTCLTFLGYEFYAFRETTIDKLATIGKIISANSTAALAFDNREDATEILAALKAEPHIVAAGLYDKDGNLFSKYSVNPAINAFPVKPGSEGYRFTYSELEGFQPVMQGTIRLGTLYLRSDLGVMYERLRLYGIIITLATIISFSLAYLLSKVLQKSISKPILALAETAKVISDHGNYSVRAIKLGKDEVGLLTDAFNNMLIQIEAQNQSLNEFNQTLEQKVTERTISLETVNKELNEKEEKQNKLVYELQVTGEQMKGKNRLLTDIAKINDTLAGIKEVPVLAQDIIQQLTHCLNAQIGTIYIRGAGNDLRWVAGYAFNKEKQENSVIIFGEGLVGQAALEKKIIILSPVPDNYIKINSSLGNSSPKNIIVYPFLYEGQVAGVIEVGSIHEFSDLDMELLNLVSANIGIAFNSSQSRMQLKELLEETQRQSEELDAQQEELKQTNEELEEKANLLEKQKEMLQVAKMDVETKAGELELTSKYKSEFLANMSHELRTPLNSILILAQLLAENKSKLLGEKEEKYAQSIYSSGTDLLNLINEILDLSKVEAGKIELEISEVNIGSVVDDLHVMFSEIANNKSIDFEIIYKNENFEHSLLTDRQRLEQVLRNFLSNAFKFTDKGGKVALEIMVTSSDQQFKNDKFRQLDQVIAFSVFDTGIGIPQNKQGIIFQAFQQADGSTKRKYGGTGLGLSISRELAHALGGEIHLQSEEGKGSTFTLYLPVKFDPSIIIPTGKEIEVKKVEEKNVISIETNESIPGLQENTIDDRYTIKENDRVILIIEDDVNFAQVLLDFFRGKNYKGIIAHQGNTGLSLARYYRPDAIILDMKLPEMDGSEVLKKLKNDPELRHIPVQIFSGYDRRKEGMELGAFDFIRKPVTQTDMQAAFNRIEEFIRKKLKKLLVVEDNREQNKAIRELIGNGDVKSFSAYGGKEAYEMMQKEKFDCIIIDLGLPDMSGIDLLEKIKTNNELGKIPVIVYTGKDLDKEEVSRLNKLADSVVLKTANSKERLLDETALFLHRVESKLPKEKQQIIRNLHRTDEVLKNKKVLIVDDDIRNIYSLTNALEEEGLKCIVAENGKEAISKLEEHSDIDIVLMDLMMPKMDGYEATQEIRRRDKFAKLPVIALTAKAMKGDREKCIEAGMSDYIAKPVNVEKLVSLMRVWLYP